MTSSTRMGFTILAVALLTADSSLAEPGREGVASDWPQQLLEAVIGGKPSLDMRARLEVADFDGPLELAEALTLRTRLGYGTALFRGFSAFAEFENVAALNDDAYFDVVSTPNGKSPIADPEVTELNRYHLKYASEEFATSVALGRQRRIDDDARFIGNVGWRQNEQTYDTVSVESSLGIDGLTLRYGYVWEVRRIFGDQGPPATRNFDSDSHLIYLRYALHPHAILSAFAYLLDFEDSPSTPLAFSTRTLGARMAGAVPISDDWKVVYALRYAYQTDAKNNPVDYGAHHVSVDANLQMASLGAAGVGYELLGSDNGTARFVTPLATGHKFNGWADVFLDNGGATGLQDLYFQLVPRLPAGLKGKVVYHEFWSDHGSVDLGREFDLVLKRPIGKHLTPLFKFAWYKAGDVPARVDRWRVWMDLTFHY